MNAPLVTVVIPTRRRPLLVQRALRSVLAQTHPALDVIVVMDGPDPDTARILTAWPDERVRVMQTAAPSGAGAARNFAAAAAKGSWIAFLDDDDEWLPDKLARQLTVAAGREVLVTCRSLVRTPAGEELWPRTLYESSMAVDEYLFDRRTPFRGDAHVGTSTFLLPTALFARTRFSTDRQNEDTTLLLRVTSRRVRPWSWCRNRSWSSTRRKRGSRWAADSSGGRCWAGSTAWVGWSHAAPIAASA